MAVVASKIACRVIFFWSGFGLHDLIGVHIGFRVVIGGNGKAVEIAIFDSHGLSFGNAFIARILPGAESFNRKRFARFGVDKSDGNFNGNELFDVTFGGRNFLRAKKIGSNYGSDAVFGKRRVDLLKHISGCGVFVAVKVVSAVFSDVRAIAPNFDEFRRKQFSPFYSYRCKDYRNRHQNQSQKRRLYPT